MLHRKGQRLSFARLITIFILALSFTILAGIYREAFLGLEPASAEKICEASNMVIAGTTTKAAGGLLEFHLGSRACKTIDITEKGIPTKYYPSTAEGAEDELRRMIVKCAEMWLMGMWGGTTLFDRNWVWGDRKCFDCYHFSLKDLPAVGKIDAAAFERSLDENAFKAKDPSDGCAVGGGGYCLSGPGEEDHKEHTKRVKSTKCKEKNKDCYVNPSHRNECEKKGGTCVLKCEKQGESCNPCEEGTVRFVGWSCGTIKKTCCIKEKNAVTHRDYIQFEREGAIIIDKEIKDFEPLKEIYTITFASMTDSYIRDVAGWNLEKGQVIYIGPLNKVEKAIEKGCAKERGINE